MHGQVVLGPLGSGKSTYTAAAAQFLTQRGRNVLLVNLDPANEDPQYTPHVDVRDLIQLNEVMDELTLGPNGGLLYCMEFLEQNITWLMDRLKEKEDSYNYVLFDCPGQVELYTHHDSMRTILHMLMDHNNTHNSELPQMMKLTAVHLVDAHYCSDPFKFVSVLLTSLSTMIKLELPHVNVLSKVDIMEKYGRLPFDLGFYTEPVQLQHLFMQMNEDPVMERYKKLNEALSELIEDFNLVSFLPLSVTDDDCMAVVTQTIDKSNGWIYGGLEAANDALVQNQTTVVDPEDLVDHVSERYLAKADGDMDLIP